MKKLSFLLIASCFVACNKDTGYTTIPIAPEMVDQAAMSQLQSDMLTAVNLVRAKGCNCNGTVMPVVDQLYWHPLLEEAALLHTQEMHDNHEFSHNSMDGRDLTDRLDEAGYNWAFGGENMVNGMPSVNEAINAFLNSETHCKTMMSANFEEMGTGKVGEMWTVNFGKRR